LLSAFVRMEKLGSTWVGYLVFVSTWLGDGLPRELRTVAHSFDRKPGREEFLPAQRFPNGEVVTRTVVGSHANLGLIECDGLVRISAELSAVARGDQIEFLPFPWSRQQ
jgi:molybdopterin biosynthesis enzyme